MAERRTASADRPRAARVKAPAAKAPMEAGTISIKLVRSPIGYRQRQKDTVRSLGLRRINQIVEQPDNPQIRGMIFAVKHLVEVIQ